MSNHSYLAIKAIEEQIPYILGSVSSSLQKALAVMVEDYEVSIGAHEQNVLFVRSTRNSFASDQGSLELRFFLERSAEKFDPMKQEASEKHSAAMRFITNHVTVVTKINYPSINGTVESMAVELDSLSRFNGIMAGAQKQAHNLFRSKLSEVADQFLELLEAEEIDDDASRV